MGKTMSTAFLHCKKAFYRYNAGHRALKYIEKDKLPIAPRYEETEKVKEVVIKENDAVFENLLKKDKNLNQYLKKVYLTSTGENPEIKVTRPLPENRTSRSEYIFREPEVVPKGSCQLSKIVKFLDDHRLDPQLWTATKIANEYELEKDQVEIILKYFGSFILYGAEYEKDRSMLLDFTFKETRKEIMTTKEKPPKETEEKSLKEVDQEILGPVISEKSKSKNEESLELKMEKSQDEKPYKVRSVSK